MWSTRSVGTSRWSRLTSGTHCGQTGRNLSATRTPSHFSIELVGGMKRSSPPSSDAYCRPRNASTTTVLERDWPRLTSPPGRAIRTPRSRPYCVSTTYGLICEAPERVDTLTGRLNDVTTNKTTATLRVMWLFRNALALISPRLLHNWHENCMDSNTNATNHATWVTDC